MKKLISCLLVFAMICGPSLTVFAAESKSSSPWDYELSEEDWEFLTASPKDTEAKRQSVNYVSEEILNLPTKELLKYFLNSPAVYASFSVSRLELISQVDYDSMAFDELIIREDLAEAVLEYGKELHNQSKSSENETAIGFFNVFINNKDVAPILNNNEVLKESSQQRQDNEPSFIDTDFIDYCRVGTTYTISNRPAALYEPVRELTFNEATEANNYYSRLYSNVIRISEPTAKYNCFSFACYQYDFSNPYWIENIEAFVYDSACTPVNRDDIEQGDIIVYYDFLGNERYIAHAGVVYGVNEQGDIIICSKWGQAGVYYHTIENSPYNVGGHILYDFYRYHDYERIYTGNNYHTGARHFYEYGDSCKICRKITNTSWTAVLCQGPPCVLVASEETFKIKR